MEKCSHVIRNELGKLINGKVDLGVSLTTQNLGSVPRQNDIEGKDDAYGYDMICIAYSECRGYTKYWHKFDKERRSIHFKCGLENDEKYIFFERVCITEMTYFQSSSFIIVNDDDLQLFKKLYPHIVQVEASIFFREISGRKSKYEKEIVIFSADFKKYNVIF